MIAQKTEQEKPLTEQEKALNGLSWVPEPKEQRFLKERGLGWLVKNPDPKKDTPKEAIIRVVYTMVTNRISNPNRPTRRPYLTRAELQEEVSRLNKLPKVSFELYYKENLDTFIIHLQDIITRNRLQYQTQPRR